MRIAYVSWEYPPSYGGGIGTYVHALAHALTARGHQVTVVAVGSAAYPVRECDHGVRVIRLPIPAACGPEPMATLHVWQARADAVSVILRALVREEGLDVIEFADYRGEGAVYLAQTHRAERPPCVMRLHTPLAVLQKYAPAKMRYRCLEEYENQAILTADRVVSPSLVLAHQLRAILPELGPVDILPHPVAPFFLEAAASSVPVSDSGEILYVGRLQELKGVETLVSAAEELLTKHPEAVLCLVGSDQEAGQGRPSMREVLRGLLPARFQRRLDMPGALPRDQLLERYRRARFCVFPSHYDNFPNTCLEAMALGKCVIGTRNSGMAEMIEDGVSGMLVASADVPALARALIHAWRMGPEERARMGAAARQRVLDIYHPDVIARRLEDQYGTYVAAHPYRGSVHPSRGDRVAVVIPCYNHGRFLPEAVASVRAQTYRQLDCVVVDDGSTDTTTLEVLDRLKREGVRVLSQQNQGLASARNAGVRATDAEFFIPLDADDCIAPTFVEDLLPALLEDSSLGYCYSYCRFFGANQETWECPPYSPAGLLIENLSVATAVVRRAAFEAAGGYSPDMVHGYEDWDFWLALLACGYRGRLVPKPLFLYRKHEGGSMLDRAQGRREEMVRKIIEHHPQLFRDLLGFAPGAPAGDDDLFRAVQAQAELDFLENSRFWRGARKLQSLPMLAWLFHAQCAEAGAGPANPCERLREIKASRTYRSIQLIKRTPMYKCYARLKYGPAIDPHR